MFSWKVIDEDVVVAMDNLARLDHSRIWFRHVHQHHAVRDLMIHIERIFQVKEHCLVTDRDCSFGSLPAMRPKLHQSPMAVNGEHTAQAFPCTADPA